MVASLDVGKTRLKQQLTIVPLSAVVRYGADGFAVYVVEDGDNGTVVGAAVVPRGNAALDSGELRKQVRGRLSAYKVPKFIWITAKQDLPFTASGKVKKSDLADQLSKLLVRR